MADISLAALCSWRIGRLIECARRRVTCFLVGNDLCCGIRVLFCGDRLCISPYLGLIRAWRTLDVAAAQYKNGLLSLEELLAWLKRCEEVATEPSSTSFRWNNWPSI